VKSNNSELIEYLEGRFTSVDERFGQVTEGFQYVVKRSMGWTGVSAASIGGSR
jgi:hypothetical protein